MAASESGDWPHDPDGEQGSEGGRKYGLAVVAKKVDEAEDFPLETEAFLAAHAEDPVRVNHRRVVSVAEIFEHVEGERFEDKVSFNAAVGAALRRGGFWDYAVE